MDAGDTMDKYGCLPDDVRFELDYWALIVWDENPATAGMDCVHSCRNGKEAGGMDHIGWSFALINDPLCPGCGEVMPDEIQGLWQMGTWDKPSRIWGYMAQELERSMRRQFHQQMKEMCCDAFEYKEKE
jgi:hypothetical protein